MVLGSSTILSEPVNQKIQTRSKVYRTKAGKCKRWVDAWACYGSSAIQEYAGEKSRTDWLRLSRVRFKHVVDRWLTKQHDCASLRSEKLDAFLKNQLARGNAC